MTTDDALPRVVPCADVVEVKATGPLTHACPYVEEVDVCTVTVGWVTAGQTIELHSLREYLDTFAGRALPHESVVGIIRDRLLLLDGLDDVEVDLTFTTAGLTGSCST